MGYFLRHNTIHSLYSFRLLREILYEQKIKFRERKSDNNKNGDIKLDTRDTKLIKFIADKYISNVEKLILLSKAKGIKLYVGIQPVLFEKK